jgi:hypothetical protein
VGLARRRVARDGWTGIVKVVKEMSSYRGGESFCDDIETSLAYVETIPPYLGCEGIFMGEDNLLTEVRTEVSTKFRRFSADGLTD